MEEKRFVTYNKSNNKIYSVFQRFITSPTVEGFFFAMVCTTLFVGSMFHAWWNLSYKYRFGEIKTVNWFSDFNFFAIVMLVVALYYSVRKVYYGREIKFDFALALLCQTMCLVAVVDYHNQDYSNIPYAWILPAGYIIGKAIVGVDSKVVSQRVECVFFSLAFGMFIASAMDFYKNFQFEPENGGLHTHSWESYWVSGLIESRCTYELGFILITASCGYMLYRARKHISILGLIILVNLIIQHCDIETTGRENRILLPVNVLLFLVLFFFDKYRTADRKRRNLYRIVIVAVIRCVALVILAFYKNWNVMYDKYLLSNWATGGGILKNDRFVINQDAFQAMLRYPTDDWAKYETIVYNYSISHSLLLEYGRAYDITVYIALVLFRLLIIKDAVILMIKKGIGNTVKYFLIPAFLSINIYYSMEPNAYGRRYFWLIGLIISGMIIAVIELWSFDSKNLT
ncbi:hypothetical protein [Pseudobutyrivibrio sp. MD2005]|uniref:hypothetical protein n=1 Tax=Pseudobutyrivibrio sp. MD2005 TaxID=1410616 RepID=UPI00047F73A7|nr:hypothetical protein [Pseudobutyrivibrio sp. MD2005]